MKKLTTLLLLLSFGLITQAQKITLLNEISQGSASSNPVFYPTCTNGTTLMMVSDGGDYLFETKGTSTSTGIFYNKGSKNYNSVFANGKLYYIADDGTHGKELWVSDGHSGTTNMIKDINPFGDGIATGTYNNMVYYNGKVYFAGIDNSASGNELWCTDGTANGTKMVKNLNTGGDGNPVNLTVANGMLFFVAESKNEGDELWKSDGTEAGTKIVQDLYPSVGGGATRDVPLGVYGNRVYFKGIESANIGFELYSSDGNTISIVKNIRPGSASSNPLYFYEYNNKLYFVADDGTNGRELWVTDGTTSGTNIAKDINPGSKNSVPTFMGMVNDKLIITATTDVAGKELWYVDKNGNINMIKDINTGSASGKINITSEFYSNVGMMTINNTYNNVIYFAGDDGTNGRELWQTDGTSTGTYMVENVGNKPTNSASSNLAFIQVDSNNVFLSMSNGDNGNEPYVYKAPIPTPQNINQLNTNTTKLYPNPNNGIFKVSLGNEYFTYGYLQLVDMTGRIVYDQSIPSGQKSVNIVLDNTPVGVYQLRVQLDNNSETHSVSLTK